MGDSQKLYIVDKNGQKTVVVLPIAHYVFDGNTADRSTLKEVIGDIKARFGTNVSVIPVVDKGMISKTNLDWLLSQGFTFIIGESKNISLTSLLKTHYLN